jgi:hypothetical protein
VGSQFSQQPQTPSYANGMPAYLGSQNFGGTCPMGNQQAPNQTNFNWAATHQTFPPAPPPPQKNGGTVTQSGPGQPITYTSPGGYKVNTSGSTVTITAPDGKSSVQQWGDPHENVNSTDGQANSGQFVKNWNAANETIMLPDGTRITMTAPAANQSGSGIQPGSALTSTSIYNGGEEVQIDNQTNTVTSQGYNVQQSLKDQKNQQMGDTQYFGPNSKSGGNYELMDLFTQEDNKITQNRQLLATMGAVNG